MPNLVRDVPTIKMLKKEIVASQKIVLVPGIFSSDGKQIIPDEAVAAIKKHLVPMATLLILRCNKAEKMLAMEIRTDDDITTALEKAHDYMQKQVVYAVNEKMQHSRKTVIYNKFMSMCRPKRLISDYVMKEAKILLESTNFNIQEISNRLGFSSQSSFSSFFMKYEKCTPADAALMIQLGAEVVFVGNGIFKSGDPMKRAKAIVNSVANYNNLSILAELSEDLGEAMVGINENEIKILMAERKIKNDVYN